jgi:CheY-like chemotaxis protein
MEQDDVPQDNDVARGLLGGVQILWLDPAPRDPGILGECLPEAGATVTHVETIDAAIAAVRASPRRFDVIITEMWMSRGIFPEDPRAPSGENTGMRFEEWLRTAEGGKLSSEEVPLLLLTNASPQFLSQHGARPPQGSRDRYLMKTDRSAQPTKLPYFLHGMLHG